ncbi:hypothetical protein CHRY9390_01124 [Chryseobacterium aquaeductus]|uniref:Uncharacterized protein n=1 Tax=Chryseobacterium aquaeductus TaxID=2675056 RepID=A0A9N8MFW5_9FLAO|nr:hypothetical protein CHRY9390_01124 [Chryseobacterium potabilaquae]CAD7803741.1 hypothetical protein CHRY9390_01124 [Chryseobacterium aquaeductus]
MKFFFSLFIIFAIAIRPVLPLLNYAVNYNYITKNLCENRNVAESDCKGKCFVKKEWLKTEKQSNNNQTIKIARLDVFLTNEILSFENIISYCFYLNKINLNSINLYSSEYFSRIFHPPLA